MLLYWYLTLLCGFGCTWAASPTVTTPATDLTITDKFVDEIDTDSFTTEISTATNETAETTDGTRSPKSATLPEFGSDDDDDALLLAFQKQLQSIAARRRQPTTTLATPVRGCGRILARHARIVGGMEAYEGEFPWTVSVRTLTTHTCGGTIVAKFWVLTAAHCVKRHTPRYYRVRTGENNIGIPGFRYDLDIPVAEINIHPSFGKPRRYSNDVALLKLRRPIKFDVYAQPICLPNPDEDFSGRNATAVGWGSTKEDKDPFANRPNKLHKVVVPILNNTICANWYADVYNGYVQIYDYQICAGYKEGGKDACQGDSGGPLITKEGDHSTLVGIVSAGVGCARKQLPGIYSRITLFVPWIQSLTGV